MSRYVAFENAKNGLLLIELPSDVVDSMLAQTDTGEVRLSVDLKNQTVGSQETGEHSFVYDSFCKHCLLEGLDDIDYILSSSSEVDDFREGQKPYRFFDTSKA